MFKTNKFISGVKKAPRLFIIRINAALFNMALLGTILGLFSYFRFSQPAVDVVYRKRS